MVTTLNPRDAGRILGLDTTDPIRTLPGARGARLVGVGGESPNAVVPAKYAFVHDDNTLQIDTDSGTQTRTLHFGGAAPADFAPTWQGYSVAQWAGAQVGRGGRTPGPNGDLGVMTTKMKAGYLRKNGVPYSDKTSLQEYFETFTEPEGTKWLVVTSIITDPTYLTGPYATTNQFKKIPDMQGWDPTPCRPDQPR